MAIECLREIGQEPHEKTKASEEGVNKYKQVFGLRAVHLMAFFIFTYVGVEVTIGGASIMTFDLPLALVLTPLEYRLDRNIYHQRTQWRCQLGIHLIWILGRWGRERHILRE